MSNVIEKIKLFNNYITYKSVVLPILALLNIIVLPLLFNFSNFIPEWQENNFLILFFTLISFIVIIIIFILVVSNIIEYNKRVEIKKVGKIKNWSDKKIRSFIIVVGILSLMVFTFGIYDDLKYSKNSINYIYIQHKEPITFIDTVVKEDSGGIAVKFVHYATFQNQKNEGRYTHMFSAARFKVGKKYEIKIIPGTKYILERKLVE